MSDNRYTITIQLPKDGELDAAISKVIEERLLSIVRSEVDKRFNSYLESVVSKVMESAFTEEKIATIIQERIKQTAYYYATPQDIKSAMDRVVIDKVDSYMSSKSEEFDSYFKAVTYTFCDDHIRKIVKEAVSSILGTSIQADVVKAVATALTSKK